MSIFNCFGGPRSRPLSQPSVKIPSPVDTNKEVKLSASYKDATGRESKPLQQVFAADVELIAKAIHNELANDIAEFSGRSSSRHTNKYSSKELNSQLKKADQYLQEHIFPILDKGYKDEGYNDQGAIANDVLLSAEDVAKTSRAFEAMAKALPYGGLKELSGLLGQRLYASWQQMKVDEYKQDLRNKYEYLRYPETNVFRSNAVNVKTAVGLPVAEVGNTNVLPTNLSVQQELGVEKGVQILSDPENFIFVNKHTISSAKSSVKASADLAKMVKGKVTGKAEVKLDNAACTMYNNADEMVDKAAHLSFMGGANRDEYKGIIKGNKLRSLKHKAASLLHKHPSAGSEVKDMEYEHQQAFNNQGRLDELLKDVLKLRNTKLETPLPARAHGPACSSSAVTVSAKFNAGAGAGVAGLEGDIEGEVKRNVWHFGLYLPTHFSDVVKEDPRRLNELPKELFQHASDAIAHTKENSHQRSVVALDKLKDLDHDLKAYYQVVNQLDGLRYRKKLGLIKSTGQEKALVKEKHALENKWQAIGRHNFMQKISASHAFLTVNATANGYKLSEQDQTVIKSALSSLKSPAIDHNKEKLNFSSAFLKDVILQNRGDTVTARANVSVGGQRGSVSYSKENLHRIHPSEVRQGDYTTKTVAVGGTVSAAPVINKLSAIVEDDEGDGNVASVVSDFISGDTNLSYNYTREYFNRDYKPEFYDRPKFKGSQDPVNLVSRTAKTKSLHSVVGGMGPVAPFLNAGATLSTRDTKRQNVKEEVKPDTLTYVFMIMHRMERNKAISPNEKEHFYNKHQKEFSEIYKNLTNPSSNASYEAQYFFDDLAEKAEAKGKYANNCLQTIVPSSMRSDQLSFSDGDDLPMNDLVYKEDAYKALDAIAKLDENASVNSVRFSMQTLGQSIKNIPHGDVLEAEPKVSALATLGWGGKKILDKKVMPGDKLSTRKQKAEDAVNILKSNEDHIVKAHQNGKPLNKQVKSAIQTLERVMRPLPKKITTDQSYKDLREIINTFKMSDEDRQQALESLDRLYKSKIGGERFYRAVEKDAENIADIVHDYYHANLTKEAVFKDNFMQAMKSFKDQPSAANEALAKEMFLDFQVKIVPSWAEKHGANWKEVAYSRDFADKSLKRSTRLLKNMGLHSRLSEQRRS